MNIGDYIRQKRKEADYTIKELSQKSGVSQGGIQQIETNRRPNPRTDTLIKLAKVLDFSDIKKETDIILTVPWFEDKKNNFYGDNENLFFNIDEEFRHAPPAATQNGSVLSFMEGTPFEDFPAPIRDDEIYPAPRRTSSEKLIPHDLLKILDTLAPEFREKARNYYINDGKFTYIPFITRETLHNLPDIIREDMIEKWLFIDKKENIKADFAISYQDNTMKEEGIRKGAFCFIERSKNIVTGDIALVSAWNNNAQSFIIRKVVIIKGIKILQDGKGNIEEFDKSYRIIGKVVRVETNLK